MQISITDHLKNILVHNRQPTTDHTVTNDFIDWVMKSEEIFKKIIPELPTRKIQGSETLLDRTLFTKIVFARFLIKHMIKHDELDVAQKARISTLLADSESKPHLNEKQKKAIRKINQMLGQNAFISNGFNFTAFYNTCFFSRSDERYPVECLLAGLMKQSEKLISSALESKTEEELDSIVNFRNILLPIDIPVYLSNLKVTINHHDNVLDFASKLSPRIEILHQLMHLMRSKGCGRVVDEWLNRYPEDKVLIDIWEFTQIASKIKKEEGDALPDISAKLHAKHPKHTKKDRLILRKMFTEFVRQAFNQDSVPVSDFQKSVAFHLESETYHAYFTYGCSAPSSLKRNGKTVALKYPLSEIFTWNHLFTLFHGHELEISFHCKAQEWLAKDFWDNWEQINHSHIYTTTVYPALSAAFDRVIAPSEERPLILDVCGGKGIIARKILNRHRVSYLLLEYNEASIREARRRLGDEAVVVNTDVVNDQEWYVDQDKQVPLRGQVIDVAIASGALAHTVLKSKEDALTVLKKIHTYLKQGGYLLLSGQTDSYVNPEDFRATGFTVINATLPTHHHFFYIVRKR